MEKLRNWWSKLRAPKAAAAPVVGGGCPAPRVDMMSCGGGDQRSWLPTRVALGVLCIVILVACLSRWTGKSGRQLPQCVSRRVRELVREAIRWSALAGQDGNAVLGLVHATYAVAYLNVARHLVSDADIASSVGVNPLELLQELQARQAAAVQALGSSCPTVQPDAGKFSVHTGWIA